MTPLTAHYNAALAASAEVKILGASKILCHVCRFETCSDHSGGILSDVPGDGGAPPKTRKDSRISRNVVPRCSKMFQDI